MLAAEAALAEAKGGSPETTFTLLIGVAAVMLGFA